MAGRGWQAGTTPQPEVQLAESMPTPSAGQPAGQLTWLARYCWAGRPWSRSLSILCQFFFASEKEKQNKSQRAGFEAIKTSGSKQMVMPEPILLPLAGDND